MLLWFASLLGGCLVFAVGMIIEATAHSNAGIGLGRLLVKLGAIMALCACSFLVAFLAVSGITLVLR